jgi:hypothetical protein
MVRECPFIGFWEGREEIQNMEIRYNSSRHHQSDPQFFAINNQLIKPDIRARTTPNDSTHKCSNKLNSFNIKKL